MQTVAVIGAGGFIGTNLCLRLAAQGRSVRAMSRHFAWPLPSKIATRQASVTDEVALRHTVEGCDLVVNLALGITPQSSVETVEEDLRAAVLPAIRLAALCRDAHARLLFLSSGGTVYGVPQTTPTPESAPCDPISPYGVVNVTIEKYLGVFAHLHGLEYRVLRVANPYGPRQQTRKGQGVIAAFLAAAIRGQPLEIWGDGGVVRDYVYIDDVIDAIDRAAVHRGAARVFNIGSGHGTSLNEIADLVERISGRKLARIMREGRKVDVPVNVLDVALARRELEWQACTPLASGLERCWQWLNIAREVA